MEYLDTQRTRPSKTDTVEIHEDSGFSARRDWSHFKRCPVIQWNVGRPRTYLPAAEKPTLFHYFAGGVGDEDDALAFFRSFGPLFQDANTNGAGEIVRESMYDWMWEVLNAKTALDSYYRLVTEDGDVFDDSQESREFRGMLNRGLKDNVYPVIGRFPDYVGAGRILLSPSNLLGAMWLMFAREVTGESVVRMCDHCLNLFAMSADSARRGKRFCSDSCRLKAHRMKSEGGETK